MMRTWERLNRGTGCVSFGLLAVAGVLGLVATGTRFGPWPALVDAGPAAGMILLPALVWAADLIRPIHTSRRRLLWCAALATTLVPLARTPAGFAAGPCLAVLASEAARVAAAARPRRRSEPARSTP